jgi:hypothetical protein
MKKIVALFSLFILAGCGHTLFPVSPKFPDAPATLKEKCPALITATPGMTLSEYTKVVVNNYTLYYECERKNEGWNEWYAEQKKIFEEAGKK